MVYYNMKQNNAIQTQLSYNIDSETSFIVYMGLGIVRMIITAKVSSKIAMS